VNDKPTPQDQSVHQVLAKPTFLQLALRSGAVTFRKCWRLPVPDRDTTPLGTWGLDDSKQVSALQLATTRPPAARTISPVIHADSSDAKNIASGAKSGDAPETAERRLPSQNSTGTTIKGPRSYVAFGCLYDPFSYVSGREEFTPLCGEWHSVVEVGMVRRRSVGGNVTA
jgi:hypothetical protein